jgi:hypothetical protein
MIPTIQFDPATLTIWTTVGTLSGPIAELAKDAMAAAVRGDVTIPDLSKSSESDVIRRRLVWLTSCVWHEKRHFFDYCVTNYGARQFRDLFVMAANGLPLVAEAKKRGEPVWFPVEMYAFPAAIRSRFGISDYPDNIKEIARLARVKKRFADVLDAPAEGEGRVIHLGGKAQLEGLAQASQLNAIQHRFGTGDLNAIAAKYIHGHPMEGPYRSIEAVAGVLGCTKELPGGITAVNIGLASALFVTALSGQFLGGGREVEASLVSPFIRLTRLLEALGPRPGNFEMTDEAAWELVDRAAKRLWNRTAVEEIENDIDRMDEGFASISEAWLVETGMSGAWSDFVTLRRRILAEVRSAGSASLSPRGFPLRWLDRLFPWHIEASPGGDYTDDDAPAVFSRKFNVPAGLERLIPPKVVWGRLRETSPERAAGGFTLSDREAWLQMLEQHAPLALLMLNGRRHHLMIPPSLERTIQDINDLGVEVRFDAEFEWPEDRDLKTRCASAMELARWSGRTTFHCDITGDEIAPNEAALLTPWEFRRSSLVSKFRDEMSGPLEFMSDVRLAADWSDWVVRRDLLQS